MLAVFGINILGIILNLFKLDCVYNIKLRIKKVKQKIKI